MEDETTRPSPDSIQEMEKTINEFVGTRLQQLRRTRGVSQRQLADELGVTFQQVQKYEAGKNRVSAGKIYRAALLFGVPPGYFFDGLADGKPQPMFSASTLRLVRQIELVPERVRTAVIALLKHCGSDD